jgi:hypothetical protein
MAGQIHEPGWPATPGLKSATKRVTEALDRHARDAEQKRRDARDMILLSRIGRIAKGMLDSGELTLPESEQGDYLRELVGEMRSKDR